MSEEDPPNKPPDSQPGDQSNHPPRDEGETPAGAQPEGTPSSAGDRKLDEDAAWREIVDNFGERAVLGEEEAPPYAGEGPGADTGTDAPADAQGPTVNPRLFELRGSYEPPDQLNTEAGYEDEGHFVPPPPPPLPEIEPHRRAAWIGLFGTPAAMLCFVLLGWRPPGWVSAVMVLAFVGGFVYLVATMNRRGPGDEYDDGAVL